MIPLKEVYNQEFFTGLCQSLYKFVPNFEEKRFLALIYDKNWKNRALKERMSHVCEILNIILTKNYHDDINILRKTALDIDIKSPYTGLSLVIFAQYVEIFGVSEENFDFSMEALAFFTSYGSSEFAVRQFFLLNPQKTTKYFLKWSKNEDYHIRRLASEGSRPRLPWGIALKDLKKDPNPIIPILENLKDDEKEYVRKSVANNLNDISKDNPQIALDLAKKWLKNTSENRKKLVKHGLRTLLKSSNQEALLLFDYEKVKNPVELFDLKNLTINIGANLEFDFRISLKTKTKLRIEYAIYFLRKNQKFSRKIFQITQKELEKGVYSFKRSHSFRKITTRKYYSGTQKIALIINGQELKTKEFLLK